MKMLKILFYNQSTVNKATGYFKTYGDVVVRPADLEVTNQHWNHILQDLNLMNSLQSGERNCAMIYRKWSSTVNIFLFEQTSKLGGTVVFTWSSSPTVVFSLSTFSLVD